MTPAGSPAHRYRMVIAVDLSEYASVVLEQALDLAARHDPCELHVLVVHEDKARLEDEKQRLAALVGDQLETFHAAEHDWLVHLHVRAGDIAEQIGALAGEAQADLLVIGRFGKHPVRRWRGGVTERVLAQAPCPTLVVQLTDHVVEATPQCPDCVAVRQATDGERWFCDAHRAPDRDSVFVSPRSAGFTGGGLMW